MPSPCVEVQGGPRLLYKSAKTKKSLLFWFTRVDAGVPEGGGPGLDTQNESSSTRIAEVSEGATLSSIKSGNSETD